MERAYRQGWVDKETRAYYHKMKTQTLRDLLRPNLIIYLDAPTSVVQNNIRMSHPWEKNSPVWEKTDYLNDWAETNKREYLKEAGYSSRVLVYDWSEGGDPEVVVEYIEQLNLDYYNKYDKQQKDWRLHNEVYYFFFNNIFIFFYVRPFFRNVMPRDVISTRCLTWVHLAWWWGRSRPGSRPTTSCTWRRPSPSA